jgi:hypothetical protein
MAVPVEATRLAVNAGIDAGSVQICEAVRGTDADSLETTNLGQRMAEDPMLSLMRTG